MGLMRFATTSVMLDASTAAALGFAAAGNDIALATCSYLMGWLTISLIAEAKSLPSVFGRLRKALSRVKVISNFTTEK